MKVRRVFDPDAGGVVCQVLSDGAWAASEAVPDFCHYIGPAGGGDAGGGALLPFQPLSFRDFMLYERHVIDATRGYTRRFIPAAYRIARAYEKVTGRAFPPFRPHKLWYRQPIYYMSNALTFVGSGTPVSAPSYSRALDYELELGAVLAKPLLNATPEQALDAIGGFVVLNDFSARDVQREEMASGFGPQKAKHFRSSMSEVLVTADELLDDMNALAARVLINDRPVVETSTAGMHYGLAEVIARVSRDEPLFPGELFGSGTLPGGSGMENGHWLKTGDVLRMEIDGVGRVEHKVVA